MPIRLIFTNRPLVIHPTNISKALWGLPSMSDLAKIWGQSKLRCPT